jgi:hypothetical protein
MGHCRCVDAIDSKSWTCPHPSLSLRSYSQPLPHRSFVRVPPLTRWQAEAERVGAAELRAARERAASAEEALAAVKQVQTRYVRQAGRMGGRQVGRLAKLSKLCCSHLDSMYICHLAGSRQRLTIEKRRCDGAQEISLAW